jgi:transposase, IS5 family
MSENLYWQFFCGFDYLQHQLPIDPSSLTRWRERIGSDGMELLLSVTVDAAVTSGAVKPSSSNACRSIPPCSPRQSPIR